MINEEEQYIEVRDIKKIDNSIYNDKIVNHKLYYPTLVEKDHNIITENIIKIIEDVNNQLCPLKKIKIKNNNKYVINSEIKQAINEKKKSYEDMKKDETIENKINYKNKKNNVQRIIRKARIDKLKNDFESTEGDNNKMWKVLKSKVYTNEAINIERIYNENKITIGSKKVAEELNKYFDNKIRNIIEQIPKNNNDPMINFKKHVKKPEKYCKLNQINYNNINTIITKMKSTNSSSKDNVTSTMLKKVKIH